MKRAIFVLLILATGVSAQVRDTRFGASLPAPGPPGTVTLTLAEYNRLSELAARKPTKVDTPPLPYALSRAAFKLRVENHSVVGTVDISGEVLETGPAKVPLTTGLTVLDARQSGSPLPLLQEGRTHAAILTGPSAFSVAMEGAYPLTLEAGRASLVISVPAASTSLLSLDLPGNHANVRVEPGLITTRTSANGHTIIEATLEPGKDVRLWWTTREIAAPVSQRAVRFLSNIKSVVSVEESQLRAAALCDVTVIQGEAPEFKILLPDGFELTEATGSTLESSEVQGGVLILRVREPARRNHQFLVVIERSNRTTTADAPLLAFLDAQREVGELLVEGAGSMELQPTESGGLRRMDVREISAIARSLVRFPLQAAFRYNRREGDKPKLQLQWTRFPDSKVLSAVAEHATITTLANVEGKSLTEVTLRVRNHAQPYVRVELPPGVTILSAEVGGESVKPLSAPDGSRVPLLRTGFNPTGPYTVSFVYLNSGTRFVKNGSYEMGLPKLDIPINLLTWEISLPDRLEVKQFGGNALAAELFPAAVQNTLVDGVEEVSQVDAGVWSQTDLTMLEPGQVGGIIVDPNGAVVANATVTVSNTQTGRGAGTRSDGDGRWVISGMSPGPITVSIVSPGFSGWVQQLELTASRPARLGTTLQAAGVTETVTVQGDNITIDGVRRMEEQARKNQLALLNLPSQNVLNLQRRVAGVLPVRVEVPRAGKSYRFVRPLVLEEETKVTFQYKSK